MPQMMPLIWMNFFMFMLLLLIIFNLNSYSSFNKNINPMKKTSIKNTWLW